MQADPDRAGPGAGSPAVEAGSADAQAAPAQAPASQPAPGIAPSRFADADPNSSGAQFSGLGPHFKMAGAGRQPTFPLPAHPKTGGLPAPPLLSRRGPSYLSLVPPPVARPS